MLNVDLQMDSHFWILGSEFLYHSGRGFSLKAQTGKFPVDVSISSFVPLKVGYLCASHRSCVIASSCRAVLVEAVLMQICIVSGWMPSQSGDLPAVIFFYGFVKFNKGGLVVQLMQCRLLFDSIQD